MQCFVFSVSTIRCKFVLVLVPLNNCPNYYGFVVSFVNLFHVFFKMFDLCIVFHFKANRKQFVRVAVIEFVAYYFHG